MNTAGLNRYQLMATRRLAAPSNERFHIMDEFEQLASDMREYAIEVRRMGYSSVAGGHENPFLELSERMLRRVDNLDPHSH